MIGYLILLFTLVPIVELALLIKVGQNIGLSNTLLIVIFTGVAGAYLARSQGLITLINIQRDINDSVMPADKLFDGVLILCGGILLLTPGLVTDAIGFAALVPFTRQIIKLWVKRRIKVMISKGQVITIRSRHVDS
ncbi:FxsA family protein [Candidatus Omnitrophota bacterium]